MSKRGEQSGVGDDGGGAVPIFPPVDERARAHARKFFEHARKAADTRNYEYAVELYAQGLAQWPDAVDEGLKPLRVVATARRLDGSKPPSFLKARKLPVGGKDATRNLNNALHLYGLDPSNVTYLEHVLKIASRARLFRLAWWVAPVLTEAFDAAKKLPSEHYAAACDAMDAMAELAAELGEDAIALDTFQACISTAQIWARHEPDSMDAQRARSSASGKCAIVKGKFDKTDGFVDSIRDADRQQDIRDRDKKVHTTERAMQLVEKARLEWEADHESAGKLFALADAMLRGEDEDLENEAIRLLEAQYESTHNYAYHAKADDIRMRQTGRHRLALLAKRKADPDNAGLQEALQAQHAGQLEMEVGIFRDRLVHYPTESRFKFELGSRLFQLRHFDDAIPYLQQAAYDGRFRFESRLLVGRCFFEKGFNDQAISTLRGAVSELESNGSKVALELNYWLGRSLEKGGRTQDARGVYGGLIQIDYNYRDARQRLEQLADEDPAGR
jgi:tetratricopeptide (TPR) repeat protein